MRKKKGITVTPDNVENIFNNVRRELKKRKSNKIRFERGANRINFPMMLGINAPLIKDIEVIQKLGLPKHSVIGVEFRSYKKNKNHEGFSTYEVFIER